MEAQPKSYLVTTSYIVEHYREPTCENEKCEFFGHPIPMTFTHKWLEESPLGSYWRDFCPKCGDGTGVRIRTRICEALKEIK